MNNIFNKNNTPLNISSVGNNLKNISLQYNEMAQALAEAMRPLIEIMADMQKQLKDITSNFAKAFRPIVAINILGKAQYVYWDYLTPDFEDTIIESKNINKTLHEICVKDGFRKVNTSILACNKHQLLIPYKRLFSQAVAAYRNKQYDLATVGLISVIDGLLTDVSGNITHKLHVRINTIIDKAVADEDIDNDEVATMSLILTFQKTMNSISANSDFADEEPKDLNRHWIMHGRSRRHKTQLDCVKLINIIYGISLISDIVSQVPDEKD